MPFNQTTFLGASIVNYNSNIGWQGAPSTLRAKVVEDPVNGDSFIEPTVGLPTTFDFNGWTFSGIIKSWRRQADESGNPTYNVTLEDPREVLEGVQLILANYTGVTSNVPNLMNIYGYWENERGFGESQRNNAGIPWKKVSEGLDVLTNAQAPDYGGAIQLGASRFRINLAGLPVLDDSYRITSESMSLLSYIKEICDNANHEFHFSLVIVGGVNFITLNTINRNVAPIFGSIDNFITTLSEVHGKSVGFEFRNEVTSKFLVGGNLSRIYLQSKDGGTDDDLETDPEDNTIWHYWGLDSIGDVIVAECLGDEHNFRLDARWVFVDGLGDEYHTDIGEMRAARDSQTSWESYLWLNNWNEFYYDADGLITDVFRDASKPNDISHIDDRFPVNQNNILLPKRPHLALETRDANGVRTLTTYLHNFKPNPHYGKALGLKIPGYFTEKELAASMSSEINTLTARITAYSLMTMTKATVAAQQSEDEEIYSPSRKLYGYVKEFSDEYYGRKYMIRIPFVSVTEESETGELLQSQDPEDSGFLDESEWTEALQNNLIPRDINKFTEENGRIFCYVRFDNANNLDFSEIPEDDIAFNYFSKEDGVVGKSAFVKCEVDPTIVFEDKDTQFSPRVVITLPGLVSPKSGNDSQQYFGVLLSFVEKTALIFNKDAKDLLSKLMGSLGSDLNRISREGLAEIPNVSAVPLKSNTETYGPWIAGGAGGKVDFEADETLVPWNYGGFDIMELAGDAKVNVALSDFQISEGGSVSFPGIPVLNIGSQLIAGGPYVSNVQVEVSKEGVLSTYRMDTWQPHPYKARKNQVDAVARLALQGQRDRRNAREQDKKSGLRKEIARRKKDYKNTPQNEIGSSHPFMVGQMFASTSGVNPQYHSEVFFQPPYNTTGQLNKDYHQKAVLSLDGMFRPFSTDVDASGYSHFERPTSSGTSVINVNSLNPFVKNTDINQATFGSGTYNSDGISLSEIPDGLNLKRFTDDAHLYPAITRGGVESRGYKDLRGLSLRAPIVLTGWGYDTDSNPVPNSGMSDDGSGTPGKFFHQDYLTRSDLWKTGPLDSRWDDIRKVWVAAGSEQKIVQILDAVPGQIDINDLNKSSGVLFFDSGNIYPIGVPEDGRYSPVTRNNDSDPFAYKGGFVYYTQEWSLDFGDDVGERVQIQATDNFHLVGNFRPNVVEPSGFWIVSKIGGKLVLDTQVNFWDYTTTAFGQTL